MIEGAAAGLGDGDERIRALLDAMAVAAGTLDARLTPVVVGRFGALRRRVESDPAAPREVLAVAALGGGVRQRARRGRGGARAAGPPGQPPADPRSR